MCNKWAQKITLVSGLMSPSKAGIALCWRTKSLLIAPSPIKRERSNRVNLSQMLQKIVCIMLLELMNSFFPNIKAYYSNINKEIRIFHRNINNIYFRKLLLILKLYLLYCLVPTQLVQQHLVLEKKASRPI